ncbi:GTP cyclohydrolase II [Hydrogenimonas sp. SS33]|uniref:GTP cyclohydrolase II n=1 Tax=Hydrogenimonas leucolamina TaxID=2954236 RepID=UPI00336BF275
MNVEISEVANLPTRHGTFKMQSFKEKLPDGCFKEHLILFTPEMPEVPVVRVHSECLTGDALGSRKCDCGEQLEFAMHFIQSQGGMLIYLRQEGRNIGLFNKVNAYALQDKGFDTVAANHQLGFSADERTYEMVETILNHYEIKKIRLLTNNPKKIESLEGVQIVERLPIVIEPNPHNEAYLAVKREKMGHLF